MSVAGYLGKGREKLRVKEGAIAEGRVKGAVLEGKMAVEEARAVDAGKSRSGALPECESVEEYDAVLRAHCRLDSSGATD